MLTVALFLSLLSLSLFKTGLAFVFDPVDTINATLWAADNAIAANYNVPFVQTQPSPIIAVYDFYGNTTTISHETLSTFLNQTSVIVAGDEADLTLSYVNILKEGYASNLLLSSFWGFNAAVNIANASTAHFDHINITTHNGAANVYAYGSNTTVYIDTAFIYSSGPVAHGLYASGNGTIYASHISQYSGGIRSSAFAGDSPGGYVHVSDSDAHTAGIGSAIFYALGEVYGTNVMALAENAPVIFMDGPQKAYLSSCDVTAGLLGGTAIFSSGARESGAEVHISDTRLTTLGEIPGLWFGNTIADVYIYDTEIKTASNILLVANFSQITQAFDHYAGYDEQPNIAPAEVFVSVAESDLSGDLVAYNGSYISWNLQSYSTWNGSAYSGFGDAYFDIYIDPTSTWILTADTTVQNLTGTLSNIQSGGFDIYYNASALLNGYLGGKTVALSGGGSALPSS